MRTCTGCRKIAPQRELVRIAVDGPRLRVDLARRRPGRGAYVHPVAACVSAPGLARSLRRAISPDDVKAIVAELSRGGDNSSSTSSSPEDPSEIRNDLNPGLAGTITVET
jgi:hypothetical protein